MFEINITLYKPNLRPSTQISAQSSKSPQAQRGTQPQQATLQAQAAATQQASLQRQQASLHQYYQQQAALTAWPG